MAGRLIETGKKMKIILMMAMTADGKIARSSMELVDWTGKADKKYFVDTSKESGVMIMGSKTYDTIGTCLPGRKSIVMSRDQSRKSTDPNLVFTDKSVEQIIQELEADGYQSAVLIGGSVINTLFMEKDLIDEIHVTMVPKFFGQGLSLFNQPLDVELELMEYQQIEKDYLLLKYNVKKL